VDPGPLWILDLIFYFERERELASMTHQARVRACSYEVSAYLEW